MVEWHNKHNVIKACSDPEEPFNQIMMRRKKRLTKKFEGGNEKKSRNNMQVVSKSSDNDDSDYEYDMQTRKREIGQI